MIEWLKDISGVLDFLGSVSDLASNPTRYRVCKLSKLIGRINGDNLEVTFHTDEIPNFPSKFVPYIAICHTSIDNYTVYRGSVGNPASFVNIVEDLVKPIYSEDFTLYVVINRDTYATDMSCLKDIAFGICLHEDKVDIVGSDRAKVILRGMLQTASTQGSLKIFM